mmetsp:Transcript_2049/g.4397  ORF Transcript_2049/g.4397 Transcript_2049/m.4397 type:complete len:83 (-) Transcript_2049:106-354(-)
MMLLYHFQRNISLSTTKPLLASLPVTFFLRLEKGLDPWNTLLTLMKNTTNGELQPKRQASTNMLNRSFVSGNHNHDWIIVVM